MDPFFTIFQHTDVRNMVKPEVRAALKRSQSSDKFEVRAMLSGAFADPSRFLNDGSTQRAFLDLVGYDRAREMRRTFRFFSVDKGESFSRSGSAPQFLDAFSPLNEIMVFTRREVRRRADGSLRIMGSSDRPGIDISPNALPSIIARFRRAAYERREGRLPANALRSVRIDFVGGSIDILDGDREESLNFDAALKPEVKLPRGEGLFDPHALFVPDIGLRLMGEDQLTLIAKELLRVLSRMGGEERIVDGWSNRRAIDGMIQTFGDVDATPFIEDVFDQLVEEGVIENGRRHLVIATYHDYLLSHIERRLQWLADIKPDMSGDHTVSAVMRSLFLALDTDAVPDELRDDEVHLGIYLSARARLKEVIASRRHGPEIRGVVHEYMKLYGDEGMAWFLGQVLPLVALEGDVHQLYQNGVCAAKAFDPHVRHSWHAYPAVVAWVREIVGTGGGEPGGGLRFFPDGMATPAPASNALLMPSSYPPTLNVAAPCIQGGVLVAGLLRIA